MHTGQDPAIGAGSEETAPVHRERLLIVHSYASLRQAIAHTLRHYRYDVLEADDLGSALRQLRSESPALLLAELAAGAEEPPQLVADLAHADALRGLPLIGLASTRIADEDARRLGLRETLVMPVEQSDLLEAVDRALEPGRRQAVVTTPPDGEAQCRLPLDDHLQAEHLSLSFAFPATTRIELRPGNDDRVTAFFAHLANLALKADVRIERSHLIFQYEPTIADALALDPDGGKESLERLLTETFPELALRPAALKQRLGLLDSEYQRLRQRTS